MKGKNKKKEKVKKNSPQSKITILKSIIEETPDFICRFKQNGKLIYANTNFCKYLNRNNENLIDQEIFPLLPIKEKEQIKKIIEKVKKTKKSKFFLSVNQSDFKKGKHIKWSVIPILNNKRNVLELQLNGCELTKKEISKKTFKEREKFESALLESERRYKSLVESTSDWIWEIDQNGFYTYSSPKIKNLLGYEPYEIIGLSPFDLMPEEEAERIRGIFNKILKAHKPFNTIENINRCKNGKTIILETSGIPIFDKRRNFIGYRGIDRDISERKKAEEALQISEEKYRSIVETTNEWIWEIDLTGKHTYSNSVVETILGYKPEDLIGKESFELIHEDDLGNVEKTFQNCIEEKKGWRDFIIRWKHKEGSYRYLESNSIPIFDQKNRLLGFRGADRNITERKKMENILRESENKYRKIFENIQDVYFKIDAEGKIIELSPSIKRYTDFESNSLIGKQVEEIYFNPDDRKELLKNIQKKGEVIDYEIRLKNKYNNIVHASLNAHFIYDNDGKFSGIEGTIRDITERKLVEEELKISEANLKKAQKVAHLGSWTWDIKNNKVTWSDEMYFLFGIDPKTFAGNLDEVINNTIFPDDLPKVIESNESVIKHKKPIPLEYRIVLPDGSNRIVWAEAGELIEDNNGDPVFLSGIVQDITERKLAEKELIEKTEEIDRFFNLTLDNLCIADTDGYFRRLNQMWESTLGYNIHELEGKKFLDLVHPNDLEATISAVGELSENKSVLNFVNRYRCKDGSYKWLDWRAYPYKNKLIYAAARDITERIKTEQQIKKINEELKDLNKNKDKFFSILAHDLKSPFQALLGLSEIISDPDEKLSETEVKEYGNRINTLLRNQYELLQNLLNWSRFQLGRMETSISEINLLDSINSVLKLFSENIKKKSINILIEVDKEIQLTADPDMLRSILQNFISNAIKFTNKNGTIKIWNTIEETNTKIIIQDDGVGISKEGLDKIFKQNEKYSTIGTEGESGSGLGFLLCKDMINKLNGKLGVESEINKGTVVTFTMPLSQ